MAISDKDIVNWFLENPEADDATIASTMNQFNVSADQVAKATGSDAKDVATRFLTQEILGQGTTSQWQGEGQGSAEQNAADMARILADAGITDLSQFGQVTKTVDAQVIPQIENVVIGYDNEYNQIIESKIVGYADQNGNAVDPSLVKTDYVYEGEGGGQTVYIAPVGTETTFGNKLTGQAVADTYGERQTGNAFGGTYAGDGNTGYRVQFDAQGNPTFYTTQASSSDIGDLAPILAIASFIPALAPFAQAINAAIAIDRGDVLGGIASLAGVGGMSEVATGLKVVKALEDGNAMGIVGALLSDPEMGKLASSTMIADGISFADAGKTFKIVNDLKNDNLLGAASTAADLSGSADAKTATAGLNLVNAIKSEDITKIAAAAGGFTNTVNATTNVVKQLEDAGLVDSSVRNIAKDTSSSITADGNIAQLPEADLNSILNTNFVAEQQGQDDATGVDAAVAAQAATPTKQTSFNDAYAAARLAYGPNANFTWNGKQYSTATATERPDLSTAVKPATDQSSAETQRLLNQSNALVTANAPNQSAAETNRLNTKNTELDIANAQQKADTAKAALKSLLGEGTAADIVIQGLSNFQQATGQTLDFLGGTGAAVGITGPNNALTNAGQSMTRTGEALQLESVNQANANVIQAINDAEGVGAKVIAGAKAIYNNPQSMNMAAIEALQEALPMGLALKSVKLLGKFGAVGLDLALNAFESGGAEYNDRYREAIKAGKTAAEADAEGTKGFYIASAVTVATGGVVDTAVVNKITKAVEKAATKTGGKTLKEAGSEFPEELLTSVLTDYALTGTADLNKGLTKGVVGTFVAGKTTASIDAASNLNNTIADVQNTFTQELNNAGIKSSNNTGDVNTFFDTTTNQPLMQQEAQQDVVSDLTTAGLNETTTPTTVGDLSVAEDTNEAVDTAGNTGVVIATDEQAGTALVMDSSGKAQVVNITGTFNSGAEVNLTTDPATKTITAAASTKPSTNIAADTSANVNVAADTATNPATAANTATTPTSNVAADVNNNAAVQQNANVAADTNTAVNVPTNVATNTATDAAVSPTANVANDAAVNVNQNVATTPNVDANINVATTPNINTNVNTDVSLGQPNVLNVGGVDIPGVYTQPNVLTPTAPPVGTPVTTPVTTPTTPATKAPTKKATPSSPFAMPSEGGGGAAMAAPLASVFYYGKDFGGQKQQVDPTGGLMMTPYDELSVTKAGAELPPQPIAQQAKGGENDIAALIQQIMSSGDNNMTQEELMQIIQARG